MGPALDARGRRRSGPTSIKPSTASLSGTGDDPALTITAPKPTQWLVGADWHRSIIPYGIGVAARVCRRTATDEKCRYLPARRFGSPIRNARTISFSAGAAAVLGD